jgi:hypothetical protein
MLIQSKDLHSKESLLALYSSVQNDIAFYRNWEWSITVYYALLSTGLITLITSESIHILLNPFCRIFLSLIQLFALYFSIRHLHSAHNHLSWNRQLRNKIENILGFFEKDIYVKDDSLLPSDLNQIPKYSNIGFTEYIFPFMLFLIIYESITIYLIWTA